MIALFGKSTVRRLGDSVKQGNCMSRQFRDFARQDTEAEEFDRTRVETLFVIKCFGYNIITGLLSLRSSLSQGEAKGYFVPKERKLLHYFSSGFRYFAASIKTILMG